MSVLVDTSVLSLALRRPRLNPPHSEELTRLLRTGSVALLGPIRQELLSGIRDRLSFERLRDQLRALLDHPLSISHYETAAEFFNLCRRRGVQGTATDFLLCAAGSIDDLPIYTTDRDFELYATLLPIKLFHGSSS